MQSHLDPSNPFAFSREQMISIVDQARLDLIEYMGGVDTIAKGLHSDITKGIEWNEGNLSYIRMFDLLQQQQQQQEDEFYNPQLPLSPNDSNTFVQRKQVFGSNTLPKVEEVVLWQLMWNTFQDKILLLLTGSAIISLSIGIYEDIYTVEYDSSGNKVPSVKWIEGVAIIIAILLVVIVTSVNDYRKEKQFRSLNAKKEDRDVYLQPGEIVCADGIFIEGNNLKCDESSATGESDAVLKLSWKEENEGQAPNPFLISGSKVIEGIGTYLVTAVGPYSFHGRSLMTLRIKNENTPLQDKLDILATQIAKYGLFATVFLMFLLISRSVIGYTTGSLSTLPSDIISHVMQILITTITVIVIAVPEGLPLAVTLAYATQRMLKDNNLVRVLAACETAGNATTICSDKTGTLTENRMEVVAGTFGSSFRFLKNPPISRYHDLINIDHIKNKVPIAVKNVINQSIAVNSTSFENMNMMGDKSLVGNKTETAMLCFARDCLGSEPFELLRSSWHLETLFPFSSSQKAMAAVIRIYDEDGKPIYRAHLKGGSEFLLNSCSSILSMHDPCYETQKDSYPISIRAMTDENRIRIDKIIQSYATRCLRTIALCYQDFDNWPSDRTLEEMIEEKKLTLLGIIGIEDPLREGVADAVSICQRAGIYVRMVTGDNISTAKSIARQCGIYTKGTIAMDGATFRKLNECERIKILPQLSVLARSSPEDKRLLVNTLRETGEIVAVTGDGTNDGPALKAADVGFSMGISGTEVAKEASSIILMDDNFSSIVRAIAWGRCVNDSIKKFIQFQLTINITAVTLIMISSIMNDKQKSILSTVQLLWVNLIMDTFAALALATDSPSSDLLNRLPERRTAPLINYSMWKMIIGQSVYQLSITLILIYTDILNLSDNEATLQTVIFTAFVFCQIFNEIK
ncbi:PMCA-type calcium-translocating P-type ATPase [Cokeromyces recurvatus]|uniref:PMCA-type calcium-translocating P-type ATPase n=1 Tax=Cokeromyces recurvatus TaxID=90255 RepID=UPI00221F36CD|nr:PMCA-type calcium-translocating P-type ATPase [Cokeromyces recurvatus]KAI7907007.1 PMCA-type calcium-translocating P-type ATPase [Cokeromyces recurvatus]